MTRETSIRRETLETSIALSLSLDQTEIPQISTNLPILNHFMSALAVHGRLSMVLEAHGDVEVDAHHLVEDVGITLGQALAKILGDRRGIQRFGQRMMPMDDALVLCALDLSGRGQLYWSGDFPTAAIGAVGSEVWPEFFNGFARASQSTLHCRHVSGVNAHHVYEAAFKGLGMALHEAVNTVADRVLSTKGVL